MDDTININADKKALQSIYHILSPAEDSRFRKIVIDVMCEACDVSAIDNCQYEGIGKLGEKQIHAAIKRFICPDISRHEIRIDDTNNEFDENGKKKRTRKFVADVLCDNVIYEIQTSSLAPLHEKIAWILSNTEYTVILIHPMIESKHINLINSDGTINGSKRSPKHERPIDIAPELYFIKDFISSDRFCLVLLLMDAQEYRTKNSKKRSRTEKYQVIPTSLNGACIFKSLEDYRYFIPDSLPSRFCAKDYAALTKIRGMDTYSTLKSLCSLGLLCTDGSIGRAVAYKRTFS